MKFGAEAIDIRVGLYEAGFIMNLIPSSQTRCLPRCEVIEVYYVPLDCLGTIRLDLWHGQTHEHET